VTEDAPADSQHEQDAEDAVQAVFCVLARRAGAIRKRGSVAAWLLAVAYRVARKARASRRRRPVPTSDLGDIPAADNSPEWIWRELRRLLLDEEVNRLPEKYRQAFVLCCLEGRTNEQAATQIGCPPGTVSSRLARARERLRGRLSRRGLVLSAGALALAVATEAARADMPPRLTEAAFRAAIAFTAGRRAAGALSPSVSALTTGYLQSRSRAKGIRVAVGLLAVILVGILLLLLRRQMTAVLRDRAPAPPPRTDEQLLQGTWVASRVENGGLIMPAGGIRLTFAGDRFTLTSNFGLRFAARFRLDATRTPRGLPGGSSLGPSPRRARFHPRHPR
jgi:RNA polymerase sigma factor (sigma-70 family)